MYIFRTVGTQGLGSHNGRFGLEPLRVVLWAKERSPRGNITQANKIEAYCLGWTFHVTDERFELTALFVVIRDSLHWWFENNGSTGYVRKRSGPQQPRGYSISIYCVDTRWLWMVLPVYDAMMIFLQTISNFVSSCPPLNINVCHPTVPHSFPREVTNGVWRYYQQAEIFGKLTIRWDTQVPWSCHWRTTR